MEGGITEHSPRRACATLGRQEGYAGATGAPVGFYPDLEFDGGVAVGDVKYKLQGADWNRGDLNQIVTFVTASDCSDGAVFSFRDVERSPLPQLGVGSQRIRSIIWPVSEEIAPEVAAQQVVATAEWLMGVTSGRGCGMIPGLRGPKVCTLFPQLADWQWFARKSDPRVGGDGPATMTYEERDTL